ncbi:MAG: glycosyltransferase family 2 protein [Parabacteroides gordonii]|uniref:glycosyltransferase family 2 protein n=1 Tax=Parabacteroides gordonii TaxID=574930 RepID=UPI003A845CAA
MEELDVSVIILTYNEEIHIRRCIENVHSFVKDVFVIDSYSTDKTLQIANEFEKVTVLQNKWENNYAKQFNWGLEHAPVQSKWVLRLDADEYLLPELINELSDKLPFLSENVSGVVFKRRHYFLGKWMKRGIYPVYLLRLFRYDKAVCEQRLMDEHIQLLEGTTVDFEGDFVDHNLNNLSWFCNKHVGYAVREAADLLDIELDLYGVSQSDDRKNLTAQAMDKRRIKHRYVRMPLFWRVFIYFCYRYFLKGGFLDGKEGFLWHFLQGWWYRTLVDAKVFEIKRACGMDREKIRKYLSDVYDCRQVESSNNK